MKIKEMEVKIMNKYRIGFSKCTEESHRLEAKLGEEKHWPLHCLMNHDYERATRKRTAGHRRQDKETELNHSNCLPHTYVAPFFPSRHSI